MKKWMLIRSALVSGCLALAACGGAGDGAPGSSAAVQRPPVAVTVQPAVIDEVRSELYSVGRIVSRNTPTLASEINARVIEVRVDEGRHVVKGQVLILLDTTAFALARLEAEADIQRLTASIANEERRVDRYRDLKTKDMMPQERLDDAEAALAVDRASLTAAQIAEQVNLSTSPCWRRINRLEKEGLIGKKVALLDAEKLGLGLVVFARIRLSKNDEASLHSFEDSVRGLAEVVECYTVTGSSDYFLKIITRDIKHYDRFLRRHLISRSLVRDINSNVAVTQIKYSTELPLYAPA